MSFESDLDRWITDVPEPIVKCECKWCQYEIYEGCAYYEYQGFYFDTVQCLAEYLSEHDELIWDEINEVFIVEDQPFDDMADVWIYLEKYKEGEN